MITKAYAFHGAVGIMAAMNTKETRIENIIVAENDVGVVIKPGIGSHYDNSFPQKNGFISALARPDCNDCYSTQLGAPCKS